MTRSLGQPALTDELTGKHLCYLGLNMVIRAFAGLIRTEEESYQWAGRLTSFPWILDKRTEGPQCPTCSEIWGIHLKDSVDISISKRKPQSGVRGPFMIFFSSLLPSGLTLCA